MAHPESLRTQFLAVSTMCLGIGVACGWWLRGDPSQPVVAAESATLATSHSTPKQLVTSHDLASEENSAAAPVDVAAAIRAPFAEADLLTRNFQLIKMVRSLGSSDLAVAVQEAMRLPEEDRLELLKMIGTHWGKIDPVAGIAFAKNLNPETRFLRIVIAAWAANDLSSAMAWMNADPTEETRRFALWSIVEETGRSHPEFAFSQLKKQPGSQGDDYGFRHLFTQWGEHNPLAAAAAAASLPPSKSRDAALDALAESWTRRDARGAFAWARGITDMRSRHVTLSSVVEAWALRRSRSGSRKCACRRFGYSGARRSRQWKHPLKCGHYSRKT